METDGQDEVPRILFPSRRPRRKKTKWPKPSGAQKAPGVSHGETLLSNVGEAPKRPKEVSGNFVNSLFCRERPAS